MADRWVGVVPAWAGAACSPINAMLLAESARARLVKRDMVLLIAFYFLSFDFPYIRPRSVLVDAGDQAPDLGEDPTSLSADRRHTATLMYSTATVAA